MGASGGPNLPLARNQLSQRETLLTAEPLASGRMRALAWAHVPGGLAAWGAWGKSEKVRIEFRKLVDLPPLSQKAEDALRNTKSKTLSLRKTFHWMILHGKKKNHQAS